MVLSDSSQLRSRSVGLDTLFKKESGGASHILVAEKENKTIQSVVCLQQTQCDCEEDVVQARSTNQQSSIRRDDTEGMDGCTTEENGSDK